MFFFPCTPLNSTRKYPFRRLYRLLIDRSICNIWGAATQFLQLHIFLKAIFWPHILASDQVAVRRYIQKAFPFTCMFPLVPRDLLALSSRIDLFCLNISDLLAFGSAIFHAKFLTRTDYLYWVIRGNAATWFWYSSSWRWWWLLDISERWKVLTNFFFT